MGEKKVVGRNIAIIVGIICVILMIGLGGAIANYTKIINDKDNTTQTLTNQKNQLQTWLNDNITNYENQINSLNSQISSLEAEKKQLKDSLMFIQGKCFGQIHVLQSEVDTLRVPKLISVNLRADDNRPLLQTPYLHVYGEVCNVGTNPAYNCKVNVVAYNYRYFRSIRHNRRRIMEKCRYKSLL